MAPAAPRLRFRRAIRAARAAAPEVAPDPNQPVHRRPKGAGTTKDLDMIPEEHLDAFFNLSLPEIKRMLRKRNGLSETGGKVELYLRYLESISLEERARRRRDEAAAAQSATRVAAMADLDAEVLQRGGFGTLKDMFDALPVVEHGAPEVGPKVGPEVGPEVAPTGLGGLRPEPRARESRPEVKSRKRPAPEPEGPASENKRRRLYESSGPFAFDAAKPAGPSDFATGTWQSSRGTTSGPSVSHGFFGAPAVGPIRTSGLSGPVAGPLSGKAPTPGPFTASRIMGSVPGPSDKTTTARRLQPSKLDFTQTSAPISGAGAGTAATAAGPPQVRCSDATCGVGHHRNQFGAVSVVVIRYDGTSLAPTHVVLQQNPLDNETWRLPGGIPDGLLANEREQENPQIGAERVLQTILWIHRTQVQDRPDITPITRGMCSAWRHSIVFKQAVDHRWPQPGGASEAAAGALRYMAIEEVARLKKDVFLGLYWAAIRPLVDGSQSAFDEVEY